MAAGYRALTRLPHEEFDLMITSVEIGMLNGMGLIAAVKLSSLITSSPEHCVMQSDGQSGFYYDKGHHAARKLKVAFENALAV